MLDILFENDDLIAINKPHGLLVHRTKLAPDVDEFALQILRDQIGQKVYPVHRLDRKTGGVLLFAKSPEINATIQAQFKNRKINKCYHAIVRGFMEDRGTIDYALNKDGLIQDAITHYHCLQRFEIPVELGKFPTSRYSLVELMPETGRFHQLRKHLAHIFHPIINDRPHGCNKQNRMWKNQFGMTNMFLHAKSLSFELPNGQIISIEAPYHPSFVHALSFLNSHHLS